MMDHQCDCPLAGYCAKHGYAKTKREHEICQGIKVAPKQRASWLRAWEEGLLPNRNPEAPPIVKPMRGVGDLAKRVIDYGSKVLTGKPVKPCGGCKGRQGALNRVVPFGEKVPLIGIPIDRTRLKKHLVYHILPLGGDAEWIWRRHIEWLKEVRSQFNGRVIIGVATESIKDKSKNWSWCSPTDVQDACKGLDAEFIVTTNKTKGEGNTFLRALMQLETTDPDEVIFYGHSKGVTRFDHPRESPPHWWASAMFDTVMRNHDEVIAGLDEHGVCGSFRMGGGFPVHLPGVGPNWFFSGTFFAVRSVDAFLRKWEDVGSFYGCVEQWPQKLFSFDNESKCLFFDQTNNLYDGDYWKDSVFPALRKWRIEHEGLLS